MKVKNRTCTLDLAFSFSLISKTPIWRRKQGELQYPTEMENYVNTELENLSLPYQIQVC
mgnify:CR=1 FL=1